MSEDLNWAVPPKVAAAILDIGQERMSGWIRDGLFKFEDDEIGYPFWDDRISRRMKQGMRLFPATWLVAMGPEVKKTPRLKIATPEDRVEIPANPVPGDVAWQEEWSWPSER